MREATRVSPTAALPACRPAAGVAYVSHHASPLPATSDDATTYRPPGGRRRGTGSMATARPSLVTGLRAVTVAHASRRRVAASHSVRLCGACSMRTAATGATRRANPATTTGALPFTVKLHPTCPLKSSRRGSTPAVEAGTSVAAAVVAAAAMAATSRAPSPCSAAVAVSQPRTGDASARATGKAGAAAAAAASSMFATPRSHPCPWPPLRVATRVASSSSTTGGTAAVTAVGVPASTSPVAAAVNGAVSDVRRPAAALTATSNTSATAAARSTAMASKRAGCGVITTRVRAPAKCTLSACGSPPRRTSFATAPHSAATSAAPTRLPVTAAPHVPAVGGAVNARRCRAARRRAGVWNRANPPAAKVQARDAPTM